MSATVEQLAEQIEAALPADTPEKFVELPNGSIIQIVRLKRPDK